MGNILGANNKIEQNEEANKSEPPKRLVKMDKFMLYEEGWVVEKGWLGLRWLLLYTVEQLPFISQLAKASSFPTCRLVAWLADCLTAAYSLTVTGKTFYALFFFTTPQEFVSGKWGKMGKAETYSTRVKWRILFPFLCHSQSFYS